MDDIIWKDFIPKTISNDKGLVNAWKLGHLQGRKQGAIEELEDLKEVMFGHPKPYASYEHCWIVLGKMIEKRLKVLKEEGVLK
jgi:hypothetical protein